MPYYYRGFDPTYLLVLIGAVICLLASARVKSTFHKYSGRRSMSGMTGAQAAERILRSAGIYDVTICHIGGSLTDNYNPSRRTLNLSDDVYGATSVAAIGVADMPSSISRDMRPFPSARRSCRSRISVPCWRGP